MKIIKLLSKIIETLPVTASKSQLLNSTAPTQVPPTDAADMVDSGHKECKWANGPTRSFIQLLYLMSSFPIGARRESFWHKSHDNLPEPGWDTLQQGHPETGFSFLLSSLVFGLSWGYSLSRMIERTRKLVAEGRKIRADSIGYYGPSGWWAKARREEEVTWELVTS